MRRFGLRENADPQTYALGIKEVWEVRGLALWRAGPAMQSLGMLHACEHGPCTP